MTQFKIQLKIRATGGSSLAWISGAMRDKKDMLSFLCIIALMRSLGYLITKNSHAFTQFLKIIMGTLAFTRGNCIASMRRWNYKETTTLIVPPVFKLFLKSAIIKLLYQQTLAVPERRLHNFCNANSLSYFRISRLKTGERSFKTSEATVSYLMQFGTKAYQAACSNSFLTRDEAFD